jgi:hypothetical protein
MAAMKKLERKPIKTGASNGHMKNLKQSILETFDIYEHNPPIFLNVYVQNHEHDR